MFMFALFEFVLHGVALLKSSKSCCFNLPHISETVPLLDFYLEASPCNLVPVETGQKTTPFFGSYS